MEITDKQVIDVSEYDDEETDIPDRRILTWWKKGQSGNPAGRPKGKTMKEYVREMLASLTDDERLEFLKSLPNDVIWRMAEGNPTEDRNIKVSVPTPILGGASAAITLETVDNVGTQLDGDVPTT